MFFKLDFGVDHPASIRGVRIGRLYREILNNSCRNRIYNFVLPIAGNHPGILSPGLGKYRLNMRRSLNTTVTGVLILAVPAGVRRRAASCPRRSHLTLLIGGGFCLAFAPAAALEPEGIV